MADGVPTPVQSLDLLSSTLDPHLAAPATFSFAVLFTLIGILLVSGRVFYMLTRQWTTHRPIESLREWADERDFQNSTAAHR